MTRLFWRYLLALAIAFALAVGLRPVAAQTATGEVYIYGHVEPRAGFVLITIQQPGGAIVEKLTDGRGEWGTSVRWRAGTYTLTCDGASAAYAFGIAQGETQSGPWVFTLAGVPTPIPTHIPTTIPTATLWVPMTAAPTITPTVSQTPTPLPQPIVTPLVMRLQSDGEDYVGEFIVDLWVDENGEVEVVNVSGAIWRREK
jgi:hypothetical protein